MGVKIVGGNVLKLQQLKVPSLHSTQEMEDKIVCISGVHAYFINLFFSCFV